MNISHDKKLMTDQKGTMTDAELSRLKRLLADIEAVNPQTTFYDVAIETLLWRIKGEERKRAEEREI